MQPDQPNNLLISNNKRLVDEIETAASNKILRPDNSTNAVEAVNSDNLCTPSTQNSESMDVTILDTPTKSESDTKDYRIIKLKNGCTALLISDSKIDHKNDTDTGKNKTEEKLAACALTVDVGSFSDPRDCEGLAHFLEHMIFMGSKKYPIENELDQYMTKHGGFDNADTNYEETSFYFEISEKYLDGALDRFSELFKEPLLLKSAMQREREAVESEFVSKMQSDTIRREGFYASLANPEYPHSIFCWGNLKTLKENITDDELYLKVHEFRARHYSSNRMYVALQARMSLDDLQNKVVTYFSDIPNNNLLADDFSHLKDVDPFQPHFYNKYFLIQPVNKISRIDISWCLPSLVGDYKSQPTNYLAYLIGHEGAGSLCSFLRKRMWGLSVVCDSGQVASFESNSLYSLFTVTVKLTNKGVNHVKEILAAVISYVRLLKEHGPSERMFNEMKTISGISFRYQTEPDAIDNVEECVTDMKYYPPKDCLTGVNIFYDFDSEKITKVVNELNKCKFNVLITSKNQKDTKYELTEKWFGTRYSMKDYPPQWLNAWQNVKPYPEFHLPIENIYLTDDFTIFSKTNLNQLNPLYPEKIFENNLCELWFRQDDKFLLPTVHFYLMFIIPLHLRNPKNTILLSIYVLYMNQLIAEELYPAVEARLDYSLQNTQDGILIRVSGYNQKIHLLLESIVNHMKDFVLNITEPFFFTFVDKYKRDLYNGYMKPKNLATNAHAKITQSNFCHLIEKNAVKDDVTFNEFCQFCIDVLLKFKIISLVQGNYLKDDAKNVILKIIDSLKFKEIENLAAQQLRYFEIPKGCKIFKYKAINPIDANSIIYNTYHIGLTNIRKTCLLELLIHIFEEPLFDVLRTKEQLAYDVSCFSNKNAHVLWYVISVNSQETKFESDYVYERIEIFHSSILTMVENMSVSDFEKHKETLIKQNEIVDTSLLNELDRNWNEIVQKKYCFNRREQNIECFKAITKTEFLEFCTDHFAAENQRKFSIHIKGNKNPVTKDTTNINNTGIDDLNEDALQNTNILLDIKKFCECLYLYPC